jgi:hypothetical protein
MNLHKKSVERMSEAQKTNWFDLEPFDSEDVFGTYVPEDIMKIIYSYVPWSFKYRFDAPSRSFVMKH